MKKLVSFLLICLMLFPMAGVAHADADTHTHEDGCFDAAYSIVAVNKDGDLLITVVSNVDDIAALLEKGRIALSMEDEISLEGIDCCIPNPPTYQRYWYTHAVVAVGNCRSYRFIDWVCTLCGGIPNSTGPTDMGTHYPGTMYGCPF